MIKKRLVAATAMATLASPWPRVAAAGRTTGSESSATETVSSLTVLDYYNDEPGKSNVGAQLKCGTSIGVATVDHQSVPGPTPSRRCCSRRRPRRCPTC